MQRPSPAVDLDSESWESPNLPRSAYATVVQDEEDSSDDERMHAAPFRAPDAAAIRAQFAGAGASHTVPLQPADAPMRAADDVIEDEEEGEDDEDEDADLDDDDELGGDEGDRAFLAAMDAAQARADKARNNATANQQAPEQDLLAQILQGGAASWKRRAPPQRDEDEGKQAADSAEEPSTSTHASISDDTIDVQIYSDRISACSATASAADVTQQLAALRLASLAFLSTYTSDFLWQKEALSLHVCNPSAHSAHAAGGAAGRSIFSAKHSSAHSLSLGHLHGQIYFGDNVEDEWFVLWLMLALTSHYPDLSVCARDSDGEFVAVEVAEVLPEDMARPEAAKNRLWIRRGQVHFIPSPSNPAELAFLPTKPTVEQALQILAEQRVKTAADGRVQQCLLKKMQPFTSAASRIPFSLSSPALAAPHYARVFLPQPLAILLSLHPQLLAEWTNNFFYRDQIDMKRANKMERILGARKTKAAKPEEESKMHDDPSASAARDPPLVPFVFMRVRFTHCLFAQLLQQRFAAPRVFARHVSSALSAMSPSPSGPLLDKAVDLGTKISVGAEMWSANQRGNVATRAKKAQIARQKMEDSAAQERDGVVALTRTCSTQHIRSAADVEAVLKSTPQLIASWQAFLAHVESRGVSALLTATPASSESTYWRSVLSAFLYSHYQPHECVDHEAVDEALLNPFEQPLFSPAGNAEASNQRAQFRVDSCVGLAYTASVLDTMDALCHLHTDENALPSSLDVQGVAGISSAVLSSLSSSLQAATFHSLPRDDSEEWMVLSPADLENMLAQSQAAASATDDADARMDSGGLGQFDGQAIVQSMNRFVNKLSDVEGAEAPKAKASMPTAASAPASASAAKPALKSILKKRSAPAAASTTNVPAVSVDSDELMRLLASVHANPSAFAFDPNSAASSFNRTFLGDGTAAVPSAASASSSLRSQLPASDSDDELLPEDDDAPPHNQNQRASSALPRGAVVVDTDEEMAGDAAAARKVAQPKLWDFMDAMDAELTQAGMQSSFTAGDNAGAAASAASADSIPFAAPAGSAVQVDVNLLSNLLQSHAAELDASAFGGSRSGAGPVTAIMSSMGLKMPVAGENQSKQA